MNFALKHRLQYVMSSIFLRLREEVAANNRNGRPKRSSDLEWDVILKRNDIVPKGLVPNPPDNNSHVRIFDPSRVRYLLVPSGLAEKVLVFGDLA